jgi:spheroidene monooxygenase
MSQVVSLSFFRFQSVPARLWAFVMMGLARRDMARVPDIGFWKLCGSGTGEGFTPIPNTAVYAILATWPDMKTAQAQLEGAPIFGRYRKKAAENWTVFLSASSARGVWAGEEPFIVSNNTQNGPLAVLTRATIKPGILARFWGRVPDISRVIGKDPNVAFKIGIGEVPWLHQVTFSIWPDAARMSAFARTGHHAEAIKAVREEGWFREELYARFDVLSDSGSWNGGSPLAELERI